MTFWLYFRKKFCNIAGIVGVVLRCKGQIPYKFLNPERQDVSQPVTNACTYVSPARLLLPFGGFTLLFSIAETIESGI